MTEPFPEDDHGQDGTMIGVALLLVGFMLAAVILIAATRVGASAW